MSTSVFFLILINNNIVLILYNDFTILKLLSDNDLIDFNYNLIFNFKSHNITLTFFTVAFFRKLNVLKINNVQHEGRICSGQINKVIIINRIIVQRDKVYTLVHTNRQ